MTFAFNLSESFQRFFQQLWWAFGWTFQSQSVDKLISVPWYGYWWNSSAPHRLHSLLPMGTCRTPWKTFWLESLVLSLQIQMESQGSLGLCTTRKASHHCKSRTFHRYPLLLHRESPVLSSFWIKNLSFYFRHDNLLQNSLFEPQQNNTGS